MEALAVALAGLGSAAAVLVLALKGWSTERRAGEQKARADALDVNLTNMAAMLADSTNREKEQRERAEKANRTITALLAEMAAAPAGGSYRRLIALISAAESAQEPTSEDNRLLKPGEDL